MTERKLLEELENRITKEYKDTESVIRKKIAYFTKDFDADNKLFQSKVKSGQMSEKDYKNWYKQQILTQKWCTKMSKEISKDITEANVTASKLMNNDVSDVFFYGCLEASKEMQGLFNFEVIDKKQIEQIMDDNKKFLPKSKVDIPKDRKWNEKRIQSSLMQSALKGESVPKLAKRLQNVVGMNKTSAIRNARTMMTGSHNMGKWETGKEAVAMGINVKKEWIATHDGRTRDSHLDIDGEVVEMDKLFSNGLEYPGDSLGDPAEVYNCRCTMGYAIGDPDEMRVERFHMVDGEDITDTWERRPDEFDFEIEDVINAQGFDGVPRVVSADEFDKYVNESNFIAQRTYSAPDQETLDAYRDQLYNGKWYVDCSNGGSAYGKGMYSVYSNGTKITKYMEKEMEGYGFRRGTDYNYIETFTLSKDANTITPNQITELREKVQNKITSGLKERGGWGSKEARDWAEKYGSILVLDDGSLATLFGYDAILTSGIDDYAIILNRTKVIFKRS